MLNSPTVEKLRAMKLHGVLAAWEAQQQDPSSTSLAFDERLALLVDAEWLARENRRLARALLEAKLRPSHACLEALDYAARRGLERSQIRQLATCRWVAEHQAVIICGATGTGKSFFACALAHQACRQGYRALYWRTSRLFHELALARAAGTYPRLLARLARVDVLVLDDWGLVPIEDQQRQDLLEILEDRYGLRVHGDHQSARADALARLPGPSDLADAICDRILHHAHRIELKGESMRKVPGSRRRRHSRMSRQSPQPAPRASQAPSSARAAALFEQRRLPGRPPPRTYASCSKRSGHRARPRQKGGTVARPAQRRVAPSVAFAPFTIADPGVHDGAKRPFTLSEMRIIELDPRKRRSPRSDGAARGSVCKPGARSQDRVPDPSSVVQSERRWNTCVSVQFCSDHP